MNENEEFLSKELGQDNPMSGREKLRLDDLIRQYPGGVTITGFGLCEDDNGNEYASFTFAEDDSKYSTGAGDILKAANFIFSKYGGCISDANEALQANPIHAQIFKIKTKKTYTKLQVIRSDKNASSQQADAASADIH